MESKASAKYLRGSAQKARLVIDMIRGKNVNNALAILQFTNKRAARPIEACLRSAIANASESAEKANVAIDPDELWVKTAFVDQGPHKNRRRVRPAPQGRAYREQRHFCHVTVMLSNDEREATTRGGTAATATTTSATPKRRKSAGAASVPRAKRTPAATPPTSAPAAATETGATENASETNE